MPQDENNERYSGRQHLDDHKGPLHAHDMSESGHAGQRDGPRKIVARAHGGVHTPDMVKRRGI